MDIVAHLKLNHMNFINNSAKARAGLKALGAQSNTTARTMSRFGGTFRGISNSIPALVAGFGAVRGAMNLGGKAAEFQRNLTNSTAIMSGVTNQVRDDMTTTAQQVAAETKFSAAQAAEAYFFLASAGMDAEQSMAALPQVAKFAQAGNFDLALATDLATDAQSALGLTSKDTAKNLAGLRMVTDVFVKGNTLANSSVQQLSEAMTNKAGGSLRQVGKDIEEGTAVLLAFADQGVKGAEAGTALNIVFRDLQTKALTNASAFEQMGVNVFDAAGEMNNTADIVRDLEHRLDGMSDAQSKATLMQLGFTDKSISFIQTLLGTSDAIREYETELRGAGNTTEQVADRQLTAFDKGMNKISASTERFAINVFGPSMEGIAPTLEAIAGAVNDLSNAFTTADETGQSAFGNLGTKLADFINMARFAFRNFDGIVRLAFTQAQLSVTTFLKDFEHQASGTFGFIKGLAFGGKAADFVPRDLSGEERDLRAQVEGMTHRLGEEWNKMFQPPEGIKDTQAALDKLKPHPADIEISASDGNDDDDKDTTTKRPDLGALTFGSSEAYSAIIAASRNQRNTAETQIVQNTKSMADAATKTLVVQEYIKKQLSQHQIALIKDLG